MLRTLSKDNKSNIALVRCQSNSRSDISFRDKNPGFQIEFTLIRNITVIDKIPILTNGTTFSMNVRTTIADSSMTEIRRNVLVFALNCGMGAPLAKHLESPPEI
jgi:hypothetical protein